MAQKRVKVYETNPVAPNCTCICANCGLKIEWTTINDGLKGIFVHTSGEEECAKRFATPLMGSSKV